ncbi:MAG: DNA internalization-related competence protein ComEC/Rec2 [Vicinamibacteria bacterium]
MSRPLLLLSAALALGAMAGPDLPLTAARLLVGLAVALLLLAWRAQPRMALWALGFASLALGAALGAAERAEYDACPLRAWVLETAPEMPVEVKGVASVDGWEAHERLMLVVDAEAIRSGGGEKALVGRVRISVGGEAPRPQIIEGDRVTVWTTLRPPRGFGDPSADDVAGRAFRSGIHATGYCKSPRLLATSRTPRPEGVLGWIPRVRDAARGTIRSAMPAGPEQDVVRAMVLGDKAGLDDETAEAFRIAGTYHVLALSGTQVALVALLVAVPLAGLGISRGWQALIVSLVVATYSVFVGGDTPVVRAAVMAAVVLWGRAIDLDGDVANLLGLAGGLLLTFRPSGIGDPGFQLSFGATLGLVVLSGPLLQGAPRLPFRAEVALATSVAAQLALAPLLLRLFHRLAPAAILLNLVAVPLSSAVLVAGLATIVVAPLGETLVTRAGDIAWIASHALIASGRLVEGVPWLDQRFPTPLPTAIVGYLLALALLATGRNRALGCAATAAGLAALLSGRPVREMEGRLALEVLDVGQGDCLIVHSPLGHVWLVDAGGSFDRPFDFGETVVGPHLWDLGVTRIDRLLLTHPHPDHVGGAPFLVRNFSVGEVWEGPAPTQDPIYAILDQQLRSLGAARRSVRRGVAGDWDGVSFEVLSPPPPGVPPLRTRNDDSLVVRLQWGNVQLLLTGDIEGTAEQRLHDGRATVLKVPHHGSRTSSTEGFLRSVAPRVAIVSVGYHSTFGHPHPEVLNRYLRFGIPLFRTDRDGTVAAMTDGRSLWVKSAVSGREEVFPSIHPGL